MSVSADGEPPTAGAVPPATLVTARFEAKYRIARAGAAALREQLSERLTSHHHSVPPGLIAGVTLPITTTVYFDTATRDLCRAATRTPVHLKVRARIYRDEHPSLRDPEPAIWIELKERDGARSRKRRTAVERSEAGRWFAALGLGEGSPAQRACGACGVASADPTAAELLADLAHVRVALGAPLVPSCVVRYRRRAFQDALSTLRVTFDDRVQAFAAPAAPFAPGGLEPEALGAPVHEEPDCVLETKSLGEPPAWLGALLAAHGAYPIEYSKLVMASLAVHGPL